MHAGDAFVFPFWDADVGGTGADFASPDLQPVQDWTPAQGALELAVAGHSVSTSWLTRWATMDRFGACGLFPGDTAESANDLSYWDIRTRANGVYRNPSWRETYVTELTFLAIVQQDPLAAGNDVGGRRILSLTAGAGATAVLAQIDDDLIFFGGLEGAFFFRVGTSPPLVAPVTAAERFLPTVVAATFKAGEFQRIYIDGILRAEGTSGIVASTTLVASQYLGVGGEVGQKQPFHYHGKIALGGWLPFAFSSDQVAAWSAEPYGFLQPEEFFFPPFLVMSEDFNAIAQLTAAFNGVAVETAGLGAVARQAQANNALAIRTAALAGTARQAEPNVTATIEKDQ